MEIILNEKPKIGKLNFNFFYDKIIGFFLKLGPRAARSCLRAGPGSPTFELAGTGRSFLGSRAGTGSGRPNVTGYSPLLCLRPTTPPCIRALRSVCESTLDPTQSKKRRERTFGLPTPTTRRLSMQRLWPDRGAPDWNGTRLAARHLHSSSLQLLCV